MTKLLLALAFVTSISAPISSEETDLEKEVRATVESLLKDLGDQNVDALADYFTADAVLIVVRERNGAFANSVETTARWIERMRANPSPDLFEERLSNIQITIDSTQLAYLRADFTIIREGKAVAGGVDVFTLLRDGEEWKVAAIAYTNVR
jgi:ketosteroid isomerase-like protein